MKKNRPSSKDRISRLPEPILQHILCFLSQKDAAKTSVLSKAWRHLWCNRPKISFCEGCTVPGGAFYSVVDRVLHGCRGLQDVTLLFSPAMAARFIKRWIPILRENRGLEKLDLGFCSIYSGFPELPAVFFEFESVRDLSLRKCVLKSTAPPSAIRLKHLRKLRLTSLYIPGELFDHLLSNCTFLENVFLSNCTGFSSEILLTNTNLQHFHIATLPYSRPEVSVAIGSEIRSLVTLDITGCSLSVNHGQLDFAHLTSLFLLRVQLLRSDLFSCTSFPCLQDLRLDRCHRIQDLNISCCPSMKHLAITNINKPFTVAVNSPNIVSFRYEGFLPQSISFGTASDRVWKWKSDVNLRAFDGVSNESPTCFTELTGLLDALSQSEISLAIDENLIHGLWNWFRTEDDSIVGVFKDKLPVAVEHLSVEESERSLHTCSSDFLNSLFRIFRPKFLIMDLFTNPHTNFYQVAQILLEGRGLKQCYSWKQFLEEVSVQAFYTDKCEWRPFEYTSFEDFIKEGADRRVRLKWGDLS